jgi:hypothetical protein
VVFFKIIFLGLKKIIVGGAGGAILLFRPWQNIDLLRPWLWCQIMKRPLRKRPLKVIKSDTNVEHPGTRSFDQLFKYLNFRVIALSNRVIHLSSILLHISISKHCKIEIKNLIQFNTRIYVLIQKWCLNFNMSQYDSKSCHKKFDCLFITLLNFDFEQFESPGPGSLRKWIWAIE